MLEDQFHFSLHFIFSLTPGVNPQLHVCHFYEKFLIKNDHHDCCYDLEKFVPGGMKVSSNDGVP